MIEIIAMNFGDTVLPIPNLSKDGVHPTTSGYKELAKSIK
jgi:lysophospholipase L1-like esterase